MLQSVTSKITISLELKTQILIDPNQTCWAHASSIDSLCNKQNFVEKFKMGGPEDKTLIFDAQPQK